MPLNLTSITTTACHAGQQQQGLARASKLPTNGAKLLKIKSGRPGLHLVSIH